MAGGAELQEGGRLARAWTTCGPNVLRHQCPDEAPGGAELDSGHGAAILLLLLFVI